MKLNVFKIPKDRIRDLRDKFRSPALGLKTIDSQKIGQYQADFFFSEDIDSIAIPWVDTYKEFFNDPKPVNKVYFACYLWENEKCCFALSYGKCHFYLRQFCDHDFGTFIAKRIANEKDIRQKSSKKFAGKRKKDIRSYAKNSRLDIESGESVDYLQAAIIDNQISSFGKSGKFGSSVLLSLEMAKEKLPDFFTCLITAQDLPENFPLPRTTNIDNTIKSSQFEARLIDSIMGSSTDTDFASNSHDLFGVDFVFSGHEKYRLSHGGNESDILDELSIETLRKFISAYSIPKEEIMGVWVSVDKEDARSYRCQVKSCLDYIVDGENVILSQGRWMEFNEDYVQQLNEYVDDIEIEATETGLDVVKEVSEDKFNESTKKFGYVNADKDFSKIKTSSNVAIEAWDLEKGETVYAVKRGTPQKLGYVCDQSTNTLELINKKANIKKLNTNFKNYCLWLVVDRPSKLSRLSEIKSIIFKQKLESWARKCREFGVIPKVKISYLKK